MTRAKQSNTWPVSSYATHVRLHRVDRKTFRVDCENCGAHEMIPDIGDDDPATAKAFNRQIQDFLTKHLKCPEDVA